MPRVKIDYVVSFSSEDPENPANNLLGWDVSKKKWLCGKGETSSSVVVQLARAVKISAVHIGAYHSSLVEVLVGRSENPNEPFQVLIPSCVFLSPIESRRGESVEKVRSFNSEQISADVRDKRWDRVRVVCSQPYNKHCKYGLSFVHIYESEESGGPQQAAVPSRAGPLSQLVPSLELDVGQSSDEDEFSPGELFAQYRRAAADTDTGAQIRQATSNVIKNNSDTSAKLVKTTIAKTASHTTVRNTNDGEQAANRDRNSMLYTSEDSEPHNKIDKVMKRHNEDKQRDDSSKKRKLEDKQEGNKDRNKNASSSKSRQDLQGKESIKRQQTGRSMTAEKTSQSKDTCDGRTNKHGHSTGNGDNDSGSERASGGELLSGVVFCLSGYENPRRSALRAAALRLGARYEPRWAAACTHLICAFPNTPKLKEVRSSPNGRAAIVVTGEWIEGCASERRRLPWRWFATEPRLRRARPRPAPAPAPAGPRAHTESDTDDEIERVVRETKIQRDRDVDRERRRSDKSDRTTHGQEQEQSRDKSDRLSQNYKQDQFDDKLLHLSGVERGATSVSRGERSVDNISDDSDTGVYDASTDEEGAGGGGGGGGEEGVGPLPALFAGRTFVVCARDGHGGGDSDGDGDGDDGGAATVERYVRAYGGLVLRPSEAVEDCEVDYVVCMEGEEGEEGEGGGRWRGARRVRPGWLWRCHETRALCTD